MLKMNIAPSCVYTIRHTNTLNDAFAKGGEGFLTEKDKWVSAQELIREAQIKQQKMFILFAAAEAIGGLTYQAELKNIVILKLGPNRFETTYYFKNLVPITDDIPISTLIVRSTGKPISEDQINGYTICKTPDFLDED